jgi:cell division protein FtsL
LDEEHSAVSLEGASKAESRVSTAATARMKMAVFGASRKECPLSPRVIQV